MDKLDKTMLSIFVGGTFILLGVFIAIYALTLQDAINELQVTTEATVTTPAPNGKPLTIDDIQPAEGL